MAVDYDKVNGTPLSIARLTSWQPASCWGCSKGVAPSARVLSVERAVERG